MNTLMLDGWTPILLSGVIFAIGMFIMSRKVSKRTLYSSTSFLSVICIGLIIYSIVGVGSWEGIGISVISIAILIGIWMGTIGGSIFKKSDN